MINLHERMLPTTAGVEPATAWSPVGRRIQLSHRGLTKYYSLITTPLIYANRKYPDQLAHLWTASSSFPLSLKRSTACQSLPVILCHLTKQGENGFVDFCNQQIGHTNGISKFTETLLTRRLKCWKKSLHKHICILEWKHYFSCQRV